MMPKLVIVAAILFGLVIARRMHQGRVRKIATDVAPLPLIPSKLLKGSDRTWVIFTTRFCAQCGPVERLLRTREPNSRVVTVDADREPQLARAFRIASAPTVLLADRNGNVLQRLVGAAAVTNFTAP